MIWGVSININTFLTKYDGSKFHHLLNQPCDYTVVCLQMCGELSYVEFASHFSYVWVSTCANIGVKEEWEEIGIHGKMDWNLDIEVESVDAFPVFQIVGCEMLATGWQLQSSGATFGGIIHGCISGISLLHPPHKLDSIWTRNHGASPEISWSRPHLGSRTMLTFGAQYVSPAIPWL